MAPGARACSLSCCRPTVPLTPPVAALLSVCTFSQKELFCIKKQHHGRGTVLFRWDPSNKYLASVGSNRRVNIFDRSGNQIDEFALQGKPNNTPIQVEWDKGGENLAVLCDSKKSSTDTRTASARPAASSRQHV